MSKTQEPPIYRVKNDPWERMNYPDAERTGYLQLLKQFKKDIGSGLLSLINRFKGIIIFWYFIYVRI